MADVKFRTVRKLIRTTVGTEDFTVAGFGAASSVKAAIFICTNAQVNDTQRANSVIGIGYTDGTTDLNDGIGIQDGVATSNTDRQHSNTKCVCALDGTSTTTLYEGDFDSFITDGIRIDITKAPATAVYVTCILIGGADATNAHCGLKSLGDGTSPVDITDPGFEPDLVLVSGVSNSNNAGTAGNAVIHIGLAHNGGNQKGVAFRDSNGSGTMQLSMYTSSSTIGGEVTASAIGWLGTVGDFDSSGFSITPSANTGFDRIYYLALKFSNNPGISVFSQDGPTSTGSKSYTEPGFTPDFGMLLLTDSTAEDTFQNSGSDGLSIATFDADNQFCSSISSEDGVSTSNAMTLSDNKVIHDLDAGSTDLTVGTFTPPFDPNGWTFNFTTAPVTARKWVGFAIGPGALLRTITDWIFSRPGLTGTANDRWFQYWDGLAIPSGTFNDRMFKWLTGDGFPQLTLTDKLAAWKIINLD